MKINKVLAIMLSLTCVVSQTYFWDDWARPETPDQVDKRNMDLRYQEKQSHIEQKKADVAAEARKKQQDLNYKKSQIELQRKRDQLKLDR